MLGEFRNTWNDIKRFKEFLFFKNILKIDELLKWVLGIEMAQSNYIIKIR